MPGVLYHLRVESAVLTAALDALRDELLSPPLLVYRDRAAAMAAAAATTFPVPAEPSYSCAVTPARVAEPHAPGCPGCAAVALRWRPGLRAEAGAARVTVTGGPYAPHEALVAGPDPGGHVGAAALARLRSGLPIPSGVDDVDRRPT